MAGQVPEQNTPGVLLDEVVPGRDGLAVGAESHTREGSVRYGQKRVSTESLAFGQIPELDATLILDWCVKPDGDRFAVEAERECVETADFIEGMRRCFGWRRNPSRSRPSSWRAN